MAGTNTYTATYRVTDIQEVEVDANSHEEAAKLSNEDLDYDSEGVILKSVEESRDR